MTAREFSDSSLLISRLTAFANPNTRDFEVQAIDLCQEFHLEVDKLSGLEPIARDDSLDLDIRFAALFCLGSALRRRHDTAKLIELVEGYGPTFREFGLYQHLKAMAYMQRSSRGDIDIAIAAATRAKQILPEHVGVLHSYVVVKLQDLEDRKAVEENIDGEHDLLTLSELNSDIATVLADEPHYGKFHATNARLQSLLGNHETARRSLLCAMYEEDASGADYPIRMIEYNSILARIMLRESLMKFAESVSEASKHALELRADFKNVVTEAQSDYLQLLGIFSAIIGLLITGVQVASNLALGDSARLMLTVSGSIILILSAVAVITEKSRAKIGYLALAGAILITAGFFLDQFF